MVNFFDPIFHPLGVSCLDMGTPDQKKRIPRRAAPADDNVASAVDLILRKLKKGQRVVLPGLGSLIPGTPPSFKSSGQRKPAKPSESGQDERG